jgi:hypothetical protein
LAAAPFDPSFFSFLKINTMQKNRISVSIDPAVKTAALASIADIREQLKPLLSATLSPADRMELLKMGDKTQAFVEKSLEYAGREPDLVPNFLDLPEAQKDYRLASDLGELSRSLDKLLQEVNDAWMLAGSEAYDAALIFYGSIKSAGRTDSGGVGSIYNELSQRFPRRQAAKPAPVAQ